MRQPTEVVPYPEGTRILHIGPPKTGTSTLQSALHANRDLLAQHDVEYAGRLKHSRSAATAAVNPTPPPGYDPVIYELWDRFAASVRSSTASRVIVSSETLSRADDDRARKIVEDLGGDVQLVLTLRPFASVLSSRWQQYVQDQTSASYPEWLAEVFGVDRPAGKFQFWHRYRLDEHIRRWGSVVGEENITFIVLDPNDRGMLLQTFDRLLGLPIGSLVPGSDFTNASLPYPDVEMIRHFNRRWGLDGRSRDEWVRSVRNLAMLPLKDRSDIPFEPYRIETPRWAAERANTASEPWIDAIRASDVRVIGDLSNLIADVSQFPETHTIPTLVPTATSGELAYLFYEAGVKWGRRSSPGKSHVDLTTVSARALAAELRARMAGQFRRR
jgi:hypothetical protein